MTTQKPTSTRKPTPAAADPPAAGEAAPECNVPRCPRTPEWRGLCAAHRQTHRGLADPKEAGR